MTSIFRWMAVLAAAFLANASQSAGEQNGASQLRKVTIGDGIELNYIERGSGTPLVFIHGTLGDYSVWEGQVAAFADAYSAIAYSRRYNYPNSNKPSPNHSALVEAEDLAALIRKLNLGKVHVVGHSYGAYAALFLALKDPELVRTLTLAEPPVVFAGDGADEAKQRIVKRSRVAFENNGPEEAVRAIVNASDEGKYDKMPPPFRALLLRNASELKALVTSNEMYPPLNRDDIRKIAVPTLLLSGENSSSSLKTASDELEHLLPEKKRKRVIIRGADHGMWFQQPEVCRKAMLAFLGAQ